MNWTRVSLLWGTAVFLSGVPAFAQVVASVVVGGPPPTVNAPYAIVQETERTQTLGDGTRIVTRSQARLYRDSYGRTRREVFLSPPGMPPSNEPSTVQIQDPVAGTTYYLRVQQRVAQLMAPLRKLSINPSVVPKPVFVPEEMRPKSISEDLGTQSIEGVLVKGTRTTTTYPEGSQGNDRPIQVIAERWLSDEIGLALLEKHSDPRFGDSVTRVVSLNRSEPDPILFQLPPDYVVQDNSKQDR